MIEWRYAQVDLANDITTITSVPCLVGGAFVTTGISAQDCPIKDSTTTVFAIPASSATGYKAEPCTGQGVRFETSLIVDPDNAATGNISVFYIPLSQPR